MTRQTLHHWRPVEGIPGRFWLEALHDDWEGLRLLLRGEDRSGPVLRIAFDAPVGYRNVNESFRLETWTSIPSRAERHTLMIIADSEWTGALVAEAGEALDGKELIHYAIYTDEDCVDVVTEFPPRVDWL